MLKKEGEIRIPSGCAICGIIDRLGRRSINGQAAVDSIRVMHDRSNGLGGGFAGYGIYPEYADYYAFHIFYDDMKAKEAAERYLDRHFEIASMGIIPTRSVPSITDPPIRTAISSTSSPAGPWIMMEDTIDRLGVSA